MNYITNYSITYGERPKMKEDQEILRYKKLSDLSISKILRPAQLQYLEKWIEINEMNELSQKLYITLRDMYTRVFNNTATITTKDDSFAWPKVEPEALPPRYDKLIESVKSKKPEARSNSRVKHQRT